MIFCWYFYDWFYRWRPDFEANEMWFTGLHMEFSV